eukprot:gene28202-42813_t
MWVCTECGPWLLCEALPCRIGWEWPDPWVFRNRSGRLFRFLDMEQGAWEHEVREAARREQWRVAALGAPARSG